MRKNTIKSIKFKLFIFHIVLVIMVVASLGYRQYSTMYSLSVDQLTNNFQNISTGLASSLSLSAAGENYANIQLPVFVEDLRENSQLIFFDMEATSNLNQKPFHITYSSSAGQVWRSGYPENYLQELDAGISKLQARLAMGKDKVKLNFLLDQKYEEKRRHYNSLDLTEKYGSKFSQLNLKGNILLDKKLGILAIKMPASHQGGGSIRFIYDARQLFELESTVIETVITESFMAFIAAALLFLLGAIWFTRPIEKLSYFVSQDFKTLDHGHVPGAKRDDEIGILARHFSNMIERTSSYLEQLEAISITDHLTGLYNRRYFDFIFPKEINKVSRYGSVLALIYLDVDNFKKYNDRYGHSYGDSVLKKIATTISGCMERNSDYVFRLGGEEFAVISHMKSSAQVELMAERIRLAVAELTIEHVDNEEYGILTISTGVAICSINSNADEAYMLADKALYQAKNSGKNCSVVMHNTEHACKSEA